MNKAGQKEKEGAQKRPPERGLSLENETHARAGAERLLKEIVVHARDRIGLFEVIAIVHTKSLVHVLVDQSLGFSVGNVEGIEPKLQADTLTELPWILKMSVNSRCCRGAPQISAAVQRDFSGVLIRLLGSQRG